MRVEKVMDNPRHRICPWLKACTCSRAFYCKKKCYGLQEWAIRKGVALVRQHTYATPPQNYQIGTSLGGNMVEVNIKKLEEGVANMNPKAATVKDWLDSYTAPVVFKVAKIDNEATGMYSSSFAGQGIVYSARKGNARSHADTSSHPILTYEVGKITKSMTTGPIFAYLTLADAERHYNDFISALPLAILECRVLEGTAESPKAVLVVRQVKRLAELPVEPVWKVVPTSELNLEFRDGPDLYIRIMHGNNCVAQAGQKGVTVTMYGGDHDYRVLPSKEVGYTNRFVIEHKEIS